MKYWLNYIPTAIPFYFRTWFGVRFEIKFILSYVAGLKISSFALKSLNPLLNMTVTLSAPTLIADLAQSKAVSPIPSTITCPFNL